MTPESKNLDKADESLREAIEQASPDQTLQAVVVLEPEDGDGASSKSIKPGKESITPQSRNDLIAQRKAELAEQIGATKQALRDKGLEVLGGVLGRTVVVKGAACDLVASLDLPGVAKATLDHAIGLGKRVKGKK